MKRRSSKVIFRNLDDAQRTDVHLRVAHTTRHHSRYHSAHVIRMILYLQGNRESRPATRRAAPRHHPPAQRPACCCRSTNRTHFPPHPLCRCFARNTHHHPPRSDACIVSNAYVSTSAKNTRTHTLNYAATTTHHVVQLLPANQQEEFQIFGTASSFHHHPLPNNKEQVRCIHFTRVDCSHTRIVFTERNIIVVDQPTHTTTIR
jgi:hypothetical protein